MRFYVFHALRYNMADKGLSGTKLKAFSPELETGADRKGHTVIDLSGDFALYDQVVTVPAYYEIEVSVRSNSKGISMVANSLKLIKNNAVPSNT